MVFTTQYFFVLVDRSYDEVLYDFLSFTGQCTELKACIYSYFPALLVKVAVNVSSSGKPVLRYMYYVNEPGLTLLMKKTP